MGIPFFHLTNYPTDYADGMVTDTPAVKQKTHIGGLDMGIPFFHLTNYLTGYAEDMVTHRPAVKQKTQKMGEMERALIRAFER
ncbi:MAG: hypothetical protein FJY97_16585 [candidate division Zixibacteria bacterium]|nr:hypothetical protein [candidate division Zixibacteria bacterium]